MESDDARIALRLADRAAAAPWIDYPPVPRWHPLFFAGYAAGVTLAIGLLDGLATSLVEVVLVGALIAYGRWYLAMRGTYPRGKAPREIRSVIIAMIVAAGALALATWALAAAVSVWLGAAVAAVGAGVGIDLYERAYARAAERVRRRLA